MKKFFTVSFIIMLVMVCLSLLKNSIVKAGICSGAKAVTGLELQIEKVNMGIITTLVDIKGLKLLNPAGFHDKVINCC